jgi:dihydropyrimidinase
VTTVIDFVIPDEDQSLADALRAKQAEAGATAWVDYAFHLNVRGDVEARFAEIPALVQAGYPSYKAFMAYEGFRLKDGELRRLLETVQAAGGMVTVHAEDGPLADCLTAELLQSGRRALADFPAARPAACETQAVERLLRFQQETSARVHIHHVSTAEAAAQIAAARAAGRPVTAETCPHYLVFSDEDYCGDLAQAAALVCAPSIKSKADQAGLWQAVADGTFSAVATDHCPYSRAQKLTHPDDFSQVPGGMAGVETRLPLLVSQGVQTGRLTPEQLAFVFSEGPAQALGLYPRKGLLVVGSDADLVLLDPNRAWTLSAAGLHSNTDCSPYEGLAVTGKPVAVALRGELLWDATGWQQPSPSGHECLRWLGSDPTQA